MKRLTPALMTGIMFGFVGLLITAYVAKHLSTNKVQTAAVVDDLIPMAIVDISPGMLVTESHLGRGPYPKDRLDPDVLRTTRVIAGRYARETIRSNQPIHANDLLPPGESPSLKISEGMRGVAIEFDERTALVGGMIHPHDYVDVLFTSRDRRDGSPTESLTMRLLEGVRVLAVRNDGDPSSDRTQPQVTLEVTESEVNMLTLARHHGAIALSLNPNGRERGGIAISNSERITLEELLGAKPAEAPVATDLYRGSRRATNQFRGDSRFVENDPSRNHDHGLPRFSRDSNPGLKSVPNPPVTPIPPTDDREPIDDSPPPTAARILNPLK